MSSPRLTATPHSELTSEAPPPASVKPPHIRFTPDLGQLFLYLSIEQQRDLIHRGVLHGGVALHLSTSAGLARLVRGQVGAIRIQQDDTVYVQLDPEDPDSQIALPRSALHVMQ